MVGSWLHGVAHKTALKARALAAKRRGRERQVSALPEPHPVQPNPTDELQRLLDQALSRLPDKYRAAVVLCELEGKTYKEAAHQLGVSAGAVSVRLVRAKAMLAKRLAQQGVLVTAGSLAAVLAHSAASASVPSSLVASTVKAASLCAVGQATAGVIPAKVLALTKGVLQAMLLRKLTTCVLVAVGLIGLGGASVTYYELAAGQNQVRDQGAVERASVPAPAITLSSRERLVIKPQQNPDDQIFSAAICPDGKIVACGLASGVRLWDAVTGKELRTVDRIMTCCTAFSPDGTMLATGHSGFIKLWDIPSGKERVTLVDGDDIPRGGMSVTFAPDGKTLAATDGKTIRRWDVSTGKAIPFNTGGWLKRDVFAIAFSPDGRKLISAENGPYLFLEHGSLKLWDVSTGKELASFTGHRKRATAVAYSPDGTTLASRGGGGEIKLWDIATGKERLALTGDSSCLAFYPDGKILASAGGEVKEVRDGASLSIVGHESIPLRDVATGAVLATLGHERAVLTVGFSRDGKILASAGMDAVRLWELEIRPAKK
jgi:hypothetical protein